MNARLFRDKVQHVSVLRIVVGDEATVRHVLGLRSEGGDEPNNLHPATVCARLLTGGTFVDPGRLDARRMSLLGSLLVAISHGYSAIDEWIVRNHRPLL